MIPAAILFFELTILVLFAGVYIDIIPCAGDNAVIEGSVQYTGGKNTSNQSLSPTNVG